MRVETYWIGSVEWNGYLWHVVSRTERGAQEALFKEYRKQKDRDTDCKTWEEFSDFFGPWIQEAKLNQVVWP
jgi:hypothetical protein